MDEVTALERLREVYADSGLEVRFYPAALTSWRWQAGLNGDGRFELLAWSATANGLIDAVSTWAKEQARNGQ